MTPRARRALDAATTVARAHGLTVGEPVVLADGQNAVVHLRPAPVVARVATCTRLLRPDTRRHFGREVALASALSAAGAAVVPPSGELPPGPHVQDGLTVSFWRHVDISTSEQPTPETVGRALGDLHAVLATLPDDLVADGSPLDTPLDDLAVFGERAAELGAEPGAVRRAGDLVARLGPLLAGRPGGLLHGDTHPGNLLGTPGGWLSTDLEDCCRGPVGWDLACLRRTARLDGRAAVDATPFPMDDEELAPFSWLRSLHVAARWHVAATREQRWLPEARALLARAVDEVTAGLGD
ncbi:phosphotransferase [Modestobacter sp. I12A-02628]|uniref:Phosphotransferase n=1 Tax=Goekera deserti TaxID=2497753 RepID=A0A7K3WH00_9ACTN|nr:phosphotransferase [Goekera deserti]MPQ99381.1 phosphotransferase [Goekera deserti]NDI48867.1 phosphotransferase [Goekera deserti]NEL55662.1 phosphotransferase [Goekera deserti]